MVKNSPSMQKTQEMQVQSLDWRSSGGGNGNPLHCSCLKNLMDRGAWWGTVMGPQRVRPSWEAEHTYWAAAAAKSLQSCPTLCDPVDGSPPGSSILVSVKAESENQFCLTSKPFSWFKWPNWASLLVSGAWLTSHYTIFAPTSFLWGTFCSQSM